MIGSKITLKIFMVVLLASGLAAQSNNRVMEINDIIQSGSTDAFIADKFDTVGQSYQNPIFPYRVSYKVKDGGVTFCHLPVVDCWALKSNGLFAFFVVLKNQDLVGTISKSYGQHESEIEVEINGRSNLPTSYSWELDKLNILLRKFRNVEGLKKYEGCSLVIIGNMTYEELVSLPLRSA